MITTLIGQLWAIPKVKVITIAGVVAIVICSFVGVRWYSNKQWAKGEQAGRQNVAEQILREKEKEWADREQQLQETSAKLEEQMRVLNRATAEIITARVALRDSLIETTARATVQREADEKIVFAVPDSDLRAAIRAVSDELASAK